MSKKKHGPKPASVNPHAALIAATAAREQEWAYALRIVEGYSWQAIRALALRPERLGGIGRSYSISTLRGLVAEYRAAQGEVVGTRDERIERRQLEIDELARAARAALKKAADVEALDVHAAKVLLDVRAAEAKMHGDDAAQRVDVEVTQRSTLDAEIDAMLGRLGQEPIMRDAEVES